MRRIKIGDVFCTKVPSGYKIYQWAYRVDRKGDYIRVFDGLYDSIPSSLEEIVNGPHSYILAFRITMAYRKGLSVFLGNFPVPPEYPFPEYQLGFFFSSADQQLLSIHVMNSDQRQHMNKIYKAGKITDLPEKFQKITLINSFRDFSLILYMFDVGFDLQHIERFYVGGGPEWDAILKKYIDILDALE